MPSPLRMSPFPPTHGIEHPIPWHAAMHAHKNHGHAPPSPLCYNRCATLDPTPHALLQACPFKPLLLATPAPLAATRYPCLLSTTHATCAAGKSSSIGSTPPPICSCFTPCGLPSSPGAFSCASCSPSPAFSALTRGADPAPPVYLASEPCPAPMGSGQDPKPSPSPGAPSCAPPSGP